MKKIEISDKGKITLETTLTQGQISKFNGLIQKMIIEDGAPIYRLMNYMAFY